MDGKTTRNKMDVGKCPYRGSIVILDNRNVIYLPFYAVIEWFQLKFRYAHLFKKKHKMRLFDLRLDYIRL